MNQMIEIAPNNWGVNHIFIRGLQFVQNGLLMGECHTYTVVGLYS